jgi:sugar/nucleoside kinase (ribokinase family)
VYLDSKKIYHHQALRAYNYGMKLSYISRKYKDIIGIGNAMVDILSYSDEAFLSSHGIVKDGMTLVGSEEITNLRKAVGPYTNMPGGSVANTMAGIAALGGTGTYIGKVHNDQMGKIFHNKLESLGIKMANMPTKKGLPTAQCIVIITPNEHRSMAVYLGATTELGPEDISAKVVKWP